MAGSIIEVTDNNFQAEVLEADKLVDFWAPWCGPCRIIAPHLEELAGEREDLQIAKLNVDENPQTAAQYNVMSIPMLLLFKGGQPVHQIIGALPRAAWCRRSSRPRRRSARGRISRARNFAPGSPPLRRRARARRTRYQPPRAPRIAPMNVVANTRPTWGSPR